MGTVPPGREPAVCAFEHGGNRTSALGILLCYNGTRGTRCRTCSKWFFYLFYPIHLLVLGILRISLQ
nr:TraX family protein [uncultured Ruminococcus sp.]